MTGQTTSVISRLLGTAVMTAATCVIAQISWAAEANTYRPGHPYLSTPASSADICEQQCFGDAQCKGWNFVKVSPRQTSGICEFNSKSVAAVPSAVSISGETFSPSRSTSIISGNPHTVRVGVPQGQEAQNPQQLAPTQRIIRQPAAPQKRIVREPIPERLDFSKTSHQTTRPATAPISAPRVYGGPVQAQTKPQAQPYPQNRPVQPQLKLQHVLDGHGNVQPRAAMPIQAPLQALPPQMQNYDPRAARAQYLAAQENRKQAAVAARMNQIQRAQQYRQSAPNFTPERPLLPAGAPASTPAQAAPTTPIGPPVPLQGSTSSLYGSLHDDVAATPH